MHRRDACHARSFHSRCRMKIFRRLPKRAVLEMTCRFVLLDSSTVPRSAALSRLETFSFEPPIAAGPGLVLRLTGLVCESYFHHDVTGRHHVSAHQVSEYSIRRQPTDAKKAAPLSERGLEPYLKKRLSTPCPRGHGRPADRRASSRGCRRSSLRWSASTRRWTPRSAEPCG
jgi:hypothetical protein